MPNACRSRATKPIVLSPKGATADGAAWPKRPSQVAERLKIPLGGLNQSLALHGHRAHQSQQQATLKELAAAAVEVQQALTGRELEVLRHIAFGLSDKEVAYRLLISPTTVHKNAGRGAREVWGRAIVWRPSSPRSDRASSNSEGSQRGRKTSEYPRPGLLSRSAGIATSTMIFRSRRT